MVTWADSDGVCLVIPEKHSKEDHHMPYLYQGELVIYFFKSVKLNILNGNGLSF